MDKVLAPVFQRTEEPPIAVKEVASPLQIALFPVMAATGRLFTVMDIELLLATAGLAQAALLVITQETICPLVRAFVVKVGLFVPTLLPLMRH